MLRLVRVLYMYMNRIVKPILLLAIRLVEFILSSLITCLLLRSVINLLHKIYNLPLYSGIL